MNACKLGSGGVTTPGMTPVPYWVWKFKWPQEIQDKIITVATPTCTLTVNDLELAGLAIVWLVHENSCPYLQYKHISSFCDNTSAVSWAYKGITSTSTSSAHLLLLLYIQHIFHQAVKLTLLSSFRVGHKPTRL